MVFLKEVRYQVTTPVAATIQGFGSPALPVDGF
jgi:hypothetical protein